MVSTSFLPRYQIFFVSVFSYHSLNAIVLLLTQIYITWITLGSVHITSSLDAVITCNTCLMNNNT